MKKTIIILLALAAITNLLLLILALTDDTSVFYGYGLVIGIGFIMFAGLLRQQIVSGKRNAER